MEEKKDRSRFWDCFRHKMTDLDLWVSFGRKTKTNLDFWDYFGRKKTCFIAKFYRTDLAIYSHSRERKTMSYSQINTEDSFMNFNDLTRSFMNFKDL